jgi:FkbM family methyltransferase
MLMRYLVRIPGVPELVGPIAHRISRTKIVPAGLRAAIGDACATNLALPGYVRSFSVSVGGTEITLGARPRVSLVGVAYYRGLDSFEPTTVALFAALVRQASVVVDIGANAGIFALLAARLRPEAQILAFEPHPMVAMSLARNVMLSGARRVEVLPTALGATIGYTTLYTTVSDVLTSLDPSRVPDPVALTVPVTTLDAVLAERKVRGVDLVKVDVEGWELPVFQGATATLARDRPVVIFEGLENTPAAAIDDLFANLNYEILVIAPGSLRRVSLAVATGTAPERNFVAVPTERLSAVLDLAGAPLSPIDGRSGSPLGGPQMTPGSGERA